MFNVQHSFMIWVLCWSFCGLSVLVGSADVLWRSWPWFPDWHRAAGSLTHLQHIWFNQLHLKNPGLHFARRQIISSTRRGTWSSSGSRSSTASRVSSVFLQRNLISPPLPPSYCEPWKRLVLRPLVPLFSVLGTLSFCSPTQVLHLRHRDPSLHH